MNEVKHEIPLFECRLILLIQNCLDQNIACFQLSFTDRSLMVVKILRKVKTDLLGTASAYSVLDDRSFDTSRTIPFCDILLLF